MLISAIPEGQSLPLMTKKNNIFMMRTIHTILAGGILLAALMTSCKNELECPEVDITTVRCRIPQIDIEEDFATGILDTLSATKATFNGSNFVWSAGDKIGIVPTSGAQIYFSVDSGAGTSTASFDGGDWAMKSTGTFYAYYPLYPDIFLSKDHVSVSYVGQTQSGNNNNLHTGDYWTLYTEGTTAVGNALSFTFNHLTSFFKTYVTVPAGTYTKIVFSAPSEVFIKEGYFDLGAQTPTIVGTTYTNELSLDLQNVTFTDETELTGYLVVAPVNIAGIPITVSVYKDGVATYEYTLTKTSAMASAKTYAFRATALTQIASSVAEANAMYAAGATSVVITAPLTDDATVVLPDTAEAVTLTLPTTASTSKLTVSYPQGATSYPATLAITASEGADLDIQTPNSTVTVNGVSYNHITSRTAASTCIIPAGISVNILKVIQGGVQVYGTVSQIDLSEQEDDAIINVSGTVTSLLGEDDEEYLPATGVTLSQSSISLTVGATETLTATVAPAGAYPEIIWSSSDEAVATVSSTGVVTAVASGTATITAKTISGGFTATCEATVELDYSMVPLTITSTGSTSVSIIKEGSPNNISLEYRKGNDSWAAYTIGSAVDLSDGESLQFRAGEGGNASFSTNLTNYYRFSVSGAGTINVSGNITSLLDKNLIRSSVPTYAYECLFYNCDNLVDASNLRLPATTLADYCYSSMFSGCTGLTSAPELPATTLREWCYSGMFSRCTGLTSAPELPATTLVYNCYSSMFYGCTGLTSAPELPATTLAQNCYIYMFSGCTGLTSAPELPATRLAVCCYDSMFSGCTGLTSAPELPATTLADYCYRVMFSGCTGLTSAPELPATILKERCYGSMFYGCTGLTSAPELPATILKECCYGSMFYGCTGLTSAPELPATTLARSCYGSMFEGCIGLISAPELPATTLADYCYDSMFKGCTGLTSAPELPATTLVQNCYYMMFYGCSNLHYIKMLATDISASLCLFLWVSGVSNTGTFVKNPSATWNVTGSDGVPSRWTVLRNVHPSSVSLNKSSISLSVGDSEQLTATVTPAEAANKTVTWVSSDTSIATVDSDGVVSAVAAGSTTITVETVDGGYTATCTVTVIPAIPSAVDLGLPSGIKWASFNVGASAPEKYGDYYAWGETEPYYSSQNPLTWKEGKTAGYTWNSYKWCMGSETTMTKYCSNSSYGYNGFTDTKAILDPEDDVAHMQLGGKWRMPTFEEWCELRNGCTWTWTTLNGVNGDLITSKTNGNSIFLPAAGYRDDTILHSVGSLGGYWSSSLYTYGRPYDACFVYFSSDGVLSMDFFNYYRHCGQSVRPVSE